MRGGAETESEISMDVPECEQAFRDAVSFMEGGGYGWGWGGTTAASALGLVMRSLDPGRLNGNH